MRLTFVRPLDGRTGIPIPGTASYLPPDGRTVDLDQPWWAERLAEGSIVIVSGGPAVSGKPPAETAAEPPAAPAIATEE